MTFGLSAAQNQFECAHTTGAASWRLVRFLQRVLVFSLLMRTSALRMIGKRPAPHLR